MRLGTVLMIKKINSNAFYYAQTMELAIKKSKLLSIITFFRTRCSDASVFIKKHDQLCDRMHHRMSVDFIVNIQWINTTENDQKARLIVVFTLAFKPRAPQTNVAAESTLLAHFNQKSNLVALNQKFIIATYKNTSSLPYQTKQSATITWN